MACATGSPTSQTDAPTLPFRLVLLDELRDRVAVAAVDGHHELHVLVAGIPRGDLVVLGRALGRRRPDLDEVDAGLLEYRLRAVEPGLDVARARCRDDPGDEVALAVTSLRIAAPTAAPAVRLFWPT